MTTAHLSFIFILVFWGGLVLFLGEAIVIFFGKAQELLLQKIGVFDRPAYHAQNVFAKVGSIFIYSSIGVRMQIGLLILVYAVLSATLGMADPSFLTLEQIYGSAFTK